MSSLRVVVACVVSLLALACAHTYALDRQRVSAPLSSEVALYVSLPEPGRYQDTLYEQSGQQTADAIVKAFAPRVARALEGSRVESAEAARRTARERGASHLVHTTIVHWEDRATEWSGQRDQVRLLIRIFEVESGKLVDAAELFGKSRGSTFGGDHPEELLDQAIADYANVLFVKLPR